MVAEGGQDVGAVGQQITLTGDEADDRQRPDTFVVCDQTGQFILRGQRHDWPHPTTPVSEWLEEKEEEEISATLKEKREAKA